MANILTKLTTLLNRVVDVVSQGNLQRVRIISQFNQVFKEAFYSTEIDRLCKVTTSPGNPKYKHELSTFYLRSGFKITIENDDNLSENDFTTISSYVIESEAFVRQLMAMGYDTLIIKGKNSFQGLQIPLKEIANLHNYMLE
ncbi:hypothetical protein [Tenacibaculum finnmarkense]|uniref:Uncharacterized protein n=1 Tax=Tenacibaculum finnmarkense genomovar finnmarkense TaxID=1458503 RepID=A0AAP1RGA2_9FLAO|nr:hypothetical protein [Tenacibaculum finnmarkense]MBE7695765.1 hypothetical protein [Tenacibaculum finnmarkense genomovar finnmarkense]MCG8751546.1 hypothetical protein [Tenacibaculum finnmarkense]MCG8770597.1 hypothetical protein [Tenacibaculum finnmarkense]MCG8775631.1 hypothetical protein [Tenacibaculum finnmarkense]MCG8872758.1 hypothetical protein [Tenacibaculum finnmarkense]